MQKKFLTNLLLLLLLNLLIKPFWMFGIDRTVQNLVGAESYGFYFAIFNFSFLFNIFLDFGITKFNNKNIAQHNHLLNKHFSGLVGLKMLLAITYGIVTFAVGLIIGYNAEQLYLLGFLAFNQFLISFILYLRSNISGLLMFKTESLLSVLDRVLMIIICGVLLWGGITNTTFKIEWFVYCQTLAYILTACVALLIVIKKASFKRLSWNPAFFILIIKQSFPFAVLVLLMTFYNRIDSVMIERLLPGEEGDKQAGIYALAFRLLDSTNMIAFLFSVLLFPLFAKMLKQKESIVEIVKLSFSLLIILSVVVAIGCHFYSYEIMDLLYHENISESAKILKWLMGGYIAISTTYIFGTLLTANGNLKELNIVAASGMVLNIALNLYFIPRLEALGAAYVSVVTQFATAITQVILVQYFFKFKINVKYLLSIIVFAVGVIIFNILSKQLNLIWYYNFGIMISASVLLAILLRLLNIRLIYVIIKEGDL
jgi:O-antigen/teichoic acid export membrane protein